MGTIPSRPLPSAIGRHWIDIGMHRSIQHHVGNSAQQRAGKRSAPGQRSVRNGQETQDPCADRLADQRCRKSNKQCACQRMGGAVEDWLALDDTHQRLDIHQDLRSAKHHEADMAATDGLEQGAWPEMKWRKGHTTKQSGCRRPAFGQQRLPIAKPFAGLRLPWESICGARENNLMGSETTAFI